MGRISPKTRSEAAAGRDPFDAYLAEIRDIPLLRQDQVQELCRVLADSEQEFRSELLGVPGTADAVLSRWRERQRAGLSTGMLAAAWSELPGPAASQALDAALEGVEKLVARRRERRRSAAPGLRGRDLDARISRALADAGLQLELLRELLGEFEGLARSSRGSRAAEAEERCGLPRGELRLRLGRARAALTRRDAARAEFASHNLRLVISIARRYRHFPVAMSDLVQEGNLGLLRAVEKFDPERGFQFSTYAVWWIEQSMVRYIQRHGRSLRLPAHVLEDQRRYSAALQDLCARLGREPLRAELAQALDLLPAEVEQIEASLPLPVTLEQPLQLGDTRNLWDVLPDANAADPAEEFDRPRTGKLLLRQLQTLRARERTVLELRFGLLDDEPLTLQEVGDRLGLSRERVRQIEAVALGRLRERAAVKALSGRAAPQSASGTACSGSPA